MTSLAARTWICRDRHVTLGERTLIMGIVNVTPDSFYDGGVSHDHHSAIAQSRRFMEEGADIIDVGGESSRPGAEPVSSAEEIRRVAPVITALREETHALISIDTTKAEVARVAMEAGAHIINDISALRHDPEMAEVAVSYGAGVVLTHMQGTPRTMQDEPEYRDVVREVGDFLVERARACVTAGIPEDRLVWDPGSGFGKTFAHNWTLLAQLPLLIGRGYPVLVGLSRKRFLGALCEREVDARLPASLAAMTCAILRGAAIIRVHDVKESCDAARVADRMKAEERKYGDLDPTASSP